MPFISNGRTLWVGPGEQFTTLNDAVASSHSGDTIRIAAGIYENDFSVITHDLRIIGVGGRAHLEGTEPIDNGKGILDIENGAEVIIRNLEFSGAQVWDDNGAGIRHHGGNLSLRNCYFHDNQESILAGDNADAHITIDRSEFANNGSGDIYTHGVYVNHIASLTVTDSYFHDTNAGHHIKSRAAATDVENCLLIDGNGDASYSIDMPNGGNGIIKGNYIEQDENGSNPTLVNYGGEDNGDNGGELWVENNTFVNHREGHSYGVRNWTGSTAHLIDNSFDGIDTIAVGNTEQDGNSVLHQNDWLID